MVGRPILRAEEAISDAVVLKEIMVRCGGQAMRLDVSFCDIQKSPPL
jgi:hypothetical protein